MFGSDHYPVLCHFILKPKGSTNGGGGSAAAGSAGAASAKNDEPHSPAVKLNGTFNGAGAMTGTATAQDLKE